MAAATPEAPLTEAEMRADAAWMLRSEHERMVALLMLAIDLVDDVQAGQSRVDCSKMRKSFGLQMRRSIACANLALAQLEEPVVPVVCEHCGTEADLLAENPLDDWHLGRVNDVLTCVICPACDDEDETGGDA